MAVTQSLTSINITRSSSSNGSSVCRVNGILEDQQQQLARFNIGDFDSPNVLPRSQNAHESQILFEDGGVACSSSSSSSFNNGDIRNEIDSDRVETLTTTSTSIIKSQLASITLPACNQHDHQHGDNLNRIEPQPQEELVTAPVAAQRRSTNCHHCVPVLESNNQQLQENLNSDQRRIRRLLAILRLWRPKTEMRPVAPSGEIEAGAVDNQLASADQQNNQNHHQPPPPHHHHHHHQTRVMIPEPGSVAASEAAIARPQAATGRHNAPQQYSCSHHMMRNPIMFVPTCASNVPFATNIAPITLAGPANQLGGVSEKKLWQSLVMPLVLGCIIFLIAVWTKQISLVLVNETLVMVIILGAVFIIMSGFAFWLAQDQVPPVLSGVESSSATTDSDSDADDNESSTGGDHAQYQRELALRLQHRHYPRLSVTNTRDPQHHHGHELNCQHGPNVGNSSAHRTSYHNHNQPHNQSHYHQHDDRGRISSRKCCGPIAIIDCQPPDYYSAMQNSVPVNLYPGQTNDNSKNNNESDNKRTSLVRINIDNDELQMCSPPTYDELINQYR